VRENPDACLLFGTKIMTGSGKAIILAVGENTLHEQEVRAAKEKGEKVISVAATIDTEIETPL
jgi:magnesium-transporting ATPase (P-type)